MNVRDLIESDEGRIAHAYKDSLGYWTIGVGRLIDERKGGHLSDAEIDMLLDNDIASCVAALSDALPWFSKLDEVRQAVLISMAFQLGVAGLLKFQITLGSVETGDYTTAGDEMLQSRWAKQTPERARRLADMMRTGRWPAT
jgi:lysozyme